DVKGDAYDLGHVAHPAVGPDGGGKTRDRVAVVGVHNGIPELTGPWRVRDGIVDPSYQPEGAHDPEDPGHGAGDRGSYRERPFPATGLEGQAGADGDGQ